LPSRTGIATPLSSRLVERHKAGKLVTEVMMDVLEMYAFVGLCVMIIIFRSTGRELPQLDFDVLDYFVIVCLAFLWPIGVFGFLVLWSLVWPDKQMDVRASSPCEQRGTDANREEVLPNDDDLYGSNAGQTEGVRGPME
jgi:hypothetical protein